MRHAVGYTFLIVGLLAGSVVGILMIVFGIENIVTGLQLDITPLYSNQTFFKGLLQLLFSSTFGLIVAVGCFIPAYHLLKDK